MIWAFYRFSVVSSASLSLVTNLQSQIESSINISLIFAPTIILLQVIPVNWSDDQKITLKFQIETFNYKIKPLWSRLGLL